MDDLTNAARSLASKYSQVVSERGGDLEVRPHRHELALSVSWREVNIYDHHDIQLDEKEGFRRWKPVRSVPEVIAIAEEAIQRWIQEGPPRDVR